MRALRLLILSVLMLLACRTQSMAQGLPVFDAANLTQNTISAIQNVITAVQAVLIQINQITELTPLHGIGIAGDIRTDMTALGTLVNQAQALQFDLSSLNSQITALFDLSTAPDTRPALTARLAQIQTAKFQAYSYAARVQTLLTTALHTVNHLQSLLDTLGSIIGNMQGNQTIGQVQTVTSKHLANLDVQMASYQRAQTVDKLSDALIQESITRIQARRIADWPTW